MVDNFQFRNLAYTFSIRNVTCFSSIHKIPILPVLSSEASNPQLGLSITMSRWHARYYRQQNVWWMVRWWSYQTTRMPCISKQQSCWQTLTQSLDDWFWQTEAWFLLIYNNPVAVSRLILGLRPANAKQRRSLAEHKPRISPEYF